MANKYYDVYIDGLGGQGILTIGDLLAHAAMAKGMAANFYPTKGMSQRGGFVQGQLRIGREDVGASLPPRGADLIISMERSEALKGVRFVKEGTEFLLYDDRWQTNATLMGKAEYPDLDGVAAKIKAAGARLYVLGTDALPEVNGIPVRANMFILGAVIAQTGIKELFSYDDIVNVLKTTFTKGLDANMVALKAGAEAKLTVV